MRKLELSRFALPVNFESLYALGAACGPRARRRMSVVGLSESQDVLNLTLRDSGGRLRQVPYPGILLGNPGPGQPTAILNRVDSIGRGPKNHKLVRDNPPSPVFPLKWVWEPQRHSIADASPRLRRLLDVREHGVVLQERILESPGQEKSETPSPPACGPNKVHLRLVRRIWSSSPLRNSSWNPVSTALRSWCLLRASALAFLSLSSPSRATSLRLEPR